jgi:hypothetical protein
LTRQARTELVRAVCSLRLACRSPGLPFVFERAGTSAVTCPGPCSEPSLFARPASVRDVSHPTNCSWQPRCDRSKRPRRKRDTHDVHARYVTSSTATQPQASPLGCFISGLRAKRSLCATPYLLPDPPIVESVWVGRSSHTRRTNGRPTCHRRMAHISGPRPRVMRVPRSLEPCPSACDHHHAHNQPTPFAEYILWASPASAETHGFFCRTNI